MGMLALIRKVVNANKATTTKTKPAKPIKLTKRSKGPIRAIPPINEFFRDPTNPYPALQALNFKTTDGAWWCCHCQAEHEVSLWKSLHPLDNMKCECSHTICADCYTTNLIRFLRQTDNAVVTLRMANYGQVCHCGVSHLAKRTALSNGECRVDFNMACDSCGRESSGNWPRFVVGDHLDWRHNSDRCYMDMIEWKLERSVRGRKTRKTKEKRKLPVIHRDADGFFRLEVSATAQRGKKGRGRQRHDSAVKAPD